MAPQAWPQAWAQSSAGMMHPRVQLPPSCAFPRVLFLVCLPHVLSLLAPSVSSTVSRLSAHSPTDLHLELSLSCRSDATLSTVVGGPGSPRAPVRPTAVAAARRHGRARSLRLQRRRIEREWRRSVPSSCTCVAHLHRHELLEEELPHTAGRPARSWSCCGSAALVGALVEVDNTDESADVAHVHAEGIGPSISFSGGSMPRRADHAISLHLAEAQTASRARPSIG